MNASHIFLLSNRRKKKASPWAQQYFINLDPFAHYLTETCKKKKKQVSLILAIQGFK